jgi:hypothetical protein
MKELEFNDYDGVTTDDDGDEHTTTVRAAVIDEDLVYVKDPNTGNNVRREVMTPTGPRQVSKGDVFVETERAGVYDYLTADAWASTGYGSAAEEDSEEVQDETPVPAKKAAAKRALPGNGNDS